MSRLTRRSVLAGTAGALVTLATPASASITSDAVDDTLTEAAIEASTDPRIRSSSLGTISDSRGDPTWVVEYDEDALESLEEWSDHEDRELLEAHEPSRTALVRSSASDIGGTFFARLFDDGLASRGYIETIDANPILELAEPIEQLDGSGFWDEIEPSLRMRDRILGTESPGADGIAFDDVETATMADVRTAVNADGLSAEPTIAVVDTGVNHADGSLFGYESDGEEDVLEDGASGTRILEASKNMITDETVGTHGLAAIEDANGHGTFVAAQVAGDPPDASHTGILPEARLLGIKALGDDGSGSTHDIASAIRYAADEGADVIVLSLGSPAYSHELDRALEYASGAGSISVAAVGNDRYASRWLSAPSSSERAIAVASVTVDGDSSYYSNVAPHPGSTDLSGGETTDAAVDLAAPGHSIETSVATTSGSIEDREFSGTSMAAPIVAAIAAALGESDTEMLRETLRDAAEPLEQAAEAEVGAGLVDADRALAGGESETDQSEAMTDDAEARDAAYRIESESRGRGIFGWL